MRRLIQIIALAVAGSALMVGVAYGAAPDAVGGFFEGCCEFLRGLWGG